MEKINLNLSVSIDVAMQILAVLKQSEQSEDCFEKIITDTSTQQIEPTFTPNVTLDDIRHAFVELAQSKGKDVAKQVIASLGYKRVTEIPQEMFSKALERVKEAL